MLRPILHRSGSNSCCAARRRSARCAGARHAEIRRGRSIDRTVRLVRPRPDAGGTLGGGRHQCQRRHQRSQARSHHCRSPGQAGSCHQRCQSAYQCRQSAGFHHRVQQRREGGSADRKSREGADAQRRRQFARHQEPGRVRVYDIPAFRRRYAGAPALHDRKAGKETRGSALRQP